MRISILQSPSWLIIDEETGLIEGVPGDSDVGSSEVIIEGTDGRIRVSEAFQVTVENRPPSFGDIPRRKGREGFHYRDSLQVNNLDGGLIRLSDAPPGDGNRRSDPRMASVLHRGMDRGRRSRGSARGKSRDVVGDCVSTRALFDRVGDPCRSSPRCGWGCEWGRQTTRP